MRPFADHAVHLQEMLPQLLKREAERKEPLRRFAFHVTRQSLVAHCTELLNVIPKRDLDGVQRWRRLLGTQGGAAGAEKVASGGLDFTERRREPRRDLLRQLASHCAAF